MNSKTSHGPAGRSDALTPVPGSDASGRRPQVVVVGGGAAGFFGAIAAAEAGCRVTVLERGPQFLTKVRISGGGRCNVTHACFEPRDFARHYPRGGKELIGPLHRFQARDTAAWFEARGVRLKTEADGRMFPTTDSSATIVDCLLRAAREAGATLWTNAGVEGAERKPGAGFVVRTAGRDALHCERLLLATGGCRSAALGGLAVSLGHALEPPAPSLFTFRVAAPWLRSLAGVSVEDVDATVSEAKLRDRGPLLVTHWGVSGPLILRLSAWGARALSALGYRFTLAVNWLPRMSLEQVTRELDSRRATHGAKRVANAPLQPLPARLWEALAAAAGLGGDVRWASLSREGRQRLARQLTRTELAVTGKSLNKDEFVTCGGVRASEVNFKTMESRVCPGLYLAGELLDIDGLTGGFNFQAAWTTGWIAGRSMAGAPA